jgi:hypothetical protein
VNGHPKDVEGQEYFYHGGINGKLTNVCCAVNGKQNSACHVDGDLKGVFGTCNVYIIIILPGIVL